MEFRRTILVDEETPASDGDYTYDLPVDPLSHLVLNFQMLNNGVNTKATLAQMLGAIEKISIIYRGANIYDLSGADLYALQTIILGKEAIQENVVNEDNAVRGVTLILPFGRKLYDPNECFVATKRGELQLKVSVDIADTGYDGMKFLFESVELVGASPKQYLKAYTLTKTIDVTGESDIDLPRGNKLLGVLLYGSVIPNGTSDVAVIDKVQMLLDNVRQYYCETKIEALHGSLAEIINVPNAWAEKFHMENTAASYTQNADTATEEQANSDLSNYNFLDFAIHKATDFSIDTSKLSEMKLRITSTTTGNLRVVPIELVSAGS